MAIAGLERTAEERDTYDDLLSDTRGLRREQAQAREAWLAGVTMDRNGRAPVRARNLAQGPRVLLDSPKPPRAVAQDPGGCTRFSRACEALGRIVDTCRAFLAERERAFVFQRYLETVLPDDRARRRLVGEVLTQDGPEQSLFVLRQAMMNLLELTTGLTRLPRVPFRLLYALLAVAQPEIAQTT